MKTQIFAVGYPIELTHKTVSFGYSPYNEPFLWPLPLHRHFVTKKQGNGKNAISEDHILRNIVSPYYRWLFKNKEDAFNFAKKISLPLDEKPSASDDRERRWPKDLQESVVFPEPDEFIDSGHPHAHRIHASSPAIYTLELSEDNVAVIKHAEIYQAELPDNYKYENLEYKNKPSFQWATLNKTMMLTPEEVASLDLVFSNDESNEPVRSMLDPKYFVTSDISVLSRLYKRERTERGNGSFLILEVLKKGLLHYTIAYLSERQKPENKGKADVIIERTYNPKDILEIIGYKGKDYYKQVCGLNLSQIKKFDEILIMEERQAKEDLIPFHIPKDVYYSTASDIEFIDAYNCMTWTDSILKKMNLELGFSTIFTYKKPKNGVLDLQETAYLEGKNRSSLITRRYKECLYGKPAARRPGNLPESDEENRKHYVSDFNLSKSTINPRPF